MLWKALQSEVIKHSMAFSFPQMALHFQVAPFFFPLSYYYNQCLILYQDSHFREAEEAKQQSCVCSQTVQLLTFLPKMKANRTRNLNYHGRIWSSESLHRYYTQLAIGDFSPLYRYFKCQNIQRLERSLSIYFITGHKPFIFPSGVPNLSISENS